MIKNRENEVEERRCARIERFAETEFETYIELLDQAGVLEAHLILETISNLPRTQLVTKIISRHEKGTGFEQRHGFDGKTLIECTERLAQFDCTNYIRWSDKKDRKLNFCGTRLKRTAEQLFLTYGIYHLKI